MTNREAVFQAILANPEDDTSRLVYADILEESGDAVDAARAELIRAQIAATSLPAEDPNRANLERRASKLFKKHKRAWFGWIPPDNLPFPTRGFLDSWFCDSLADFHDQTAETFAREPISSLTLAVPGESLGQLADWPYLAQIRTLKLWPGRVTSDVLVRFLSSKHLVHLRELELMGNWATPWSYVSPAVEFLAGCPQYASLRSLEINQMHVGDAGAAALAASKTLTGLTSLAVSRCEMGAAGLQRLLASPILAGVTHLTLGGREHTATEGEALAAALASSPHLGRLEALALSETSATDRAATSLAAARCPNLKSLTLIPHVPGHDDQPTGCEPLSPAGLEALLGAGFARGIEALDLDGQTFGDSGAVVLARAGLPRLRRLSLIGSGLTAVGLRPLIMVYSGHLEYLQLARCPLGDEGAVLLADVSWPAMARASKSEEEGWSDVGLGLGSCGIGASGVTALLESSRIPSSIPTLFLGSGVTPELEARLKEKYPQAMIRL
jgi:uncharacterized protein (TIGR02996 family)